ncbi:unnamed protein product, partial [Ixodes hexagonus]
LGLKVTTIHKILILKTYIKDYIYINTKLRCQSKNAFEKDSFKLTNNAVYRKTTENVRNRQLIELKIYLQTNQYTSECQF